MKIGKSPLRKEHAIDSHVSIFVLNPRDEIKYTLITSKKL